MVVFWDFAEALKYGIWPENFFIVLVYIGVTGW